MALTEAEKRDLTAMGWQQGHQAAEYSEPDDTDFSEAGVDGDSIEDLDKLDYSDAVDVLTSAAYQGEQNSRDYAGHPTYEITHEYGGPDRDEYDIEEAYEHYEAGITKGIERGVAKRLGPESKWKSGLSGLSNAYLGGVLGQIRRHGPGKFSTILDKYLWEMSLGWGGADEEAGYEEGGGFFGLIRFDPGLIPSLQNVAAEYGDRLTRDEADEIRKNVGVIMFERADGIVEVAYYDKTKALEGDWNRVLEDVYGKEALDGISARDIREFRGFLRNATDRQVQGSYDKEMRAGRDEYAELAVAEAEDRGIYLEL